MRRVPVSSHQRQRSETFPLTPETRVAARRSSRVRFLLPWVGAVIMAFLLFRLLFGHVYVMRGSCACGQVEQWYEFNDRSYTIGIRVSPEVLTSSEVQHSHTYLEPTRIKRY